MEIRICTRCRRIRPGTAVCPDCGDAVALRTPEFLVGETFDRYRIERVIGAGGMGVVYAVSDADRGRTWALKMVVPSDPSGVEARRLLREARLLARLDHPNIVRVIHCDDGPWGAPYYVMKYVEGRPLRAVMQDHPGGMPLDEVRRHVREIAAGLSHAHERGIVHRDLKPENVIVASGAPGATDRILDFGIAKTVTADHDTTQLTGTGQLLGTPAYLAPEQLANVAVGPHTDQHALGLIAAEMLSGRRVRSGKTLGEIIADELNRPVPEELFAGKAVPPLVRETLLRATQPDPADRFPDVRTFAAALDGKVSPAIGLRRPPVRARRPRRRLVATAAVVLLAAAAVAAWARWGRAPDAGAPGGGAPFERVAEATVPPDATRIAARRGDVTVLVGSGTLYLLADERGSVPAAAPPAADRRLAGRLTDGRLWMGAGSTVRLRDPLDGEETTRIDFLPPGELLACTPSGEHCALRDGDRITVCLRADGTCLPAVAADLPGADAVTALADRFLAMAGSEGLRVIATHDGSVRLSAALGERRVRAVAIDETSGWVAVGGWFDDVRLFDLHGSGEERRVPRRGQTLALGFVPDGPSLWVGGEGGVLLWDLASDESFASGNAADRVTDVHVAGDGLWAIDAAGRRLLRFARRPFALPAARAVSPREIWALAADGAGRTLWAGSSDGILYALDATGRSTGGRTLHTQGITALAADDRFLATASDDKTVAVWGLPDLEVRKRSRAHGFLVNALWLDEDGSALWTTSSDGTIKRWTWPDLEERASVATGERSLATVWVSADETLILAGTWNHALLRLRGGLAGWTVETEIPVPSHSLYGSVPVPAAEAVLFVGTGPGGVYAYDLRTDRLHRLASGDADVYASVADGEDGAVVLGTGTALHYRFRRDASGALRYEVRGRVHTDLGMVLAAAAVGTTGRIAVGNGRGEVRVVARDDLRGRPLGPERPVEEVLP